MYKIKAQSMETTHTISRFGPKESEEFIRKIFKFRSSQPEKSSRPVHNTTFPITQLPREIIQEILKYVPESTVNLGMTCKGYVMCVNCLRKVCIYNIVKKHGMNVAQEYARDGMFYCYTCTPSEL